MGVHAVAQRFDFVCGQFDAGDHAAGDAGGVCFHQLRALYDGAEGVFFGQHPRKAERGDFSDGEAAGAGRRAEFLFLRVGVGEVGKEHRRLGEQRPVQLFLRAGKHFVDDAGADILGDAEQFFYFGEVFDVRRHAGDLRPLPGEQEG